MYLAKIVIQPRPTVNDPQGQTIQAALRQLGFGSVDRVRAGKYMELRIDEACEDEAARQVQDMCDRLLANPVIEDYRFELEALTE